MVGVPSESAGNHGLPAEVTRVGYFDASAAYNIAYDFDPQNYQFQPGHGYMLYSEGTEATSWIIDY